MAGCETEAWAGAASSKPQKVELLSVLRQNLMARRIEGRSTCTGKRELSAALDRSEALL
jgi:hypothetical protein